MKSKCATYLRVIWAVEPTILNAKTSSSVPLVWRLAVGYAH